MSLFSGLVNLNDTFGALLVGTVVSAILLGGIYLQAYFYFMTYSDGPLIKMVVILLIVLETLFVALSIHSLNHYLIINYFNPLALLKNVWSLDISYGVIGTNVLIVHLSYAYRIYHVNGQQALIPTAIVIVAFIHHSLGWVLVAVLFRLSSLEQIPGLPEMLGKAILSSAAVIDITIASTLSYYLHKKRTGFKQTDKLINRLIKYTINNGILTSVMDLVTLSLIIARPRDCLFFAFSQILSTLYGNSLLATFNSRRPTAHQSHNIISNTSFLSHPPSHGVFNIGRSAADTTEAATLSTNVHDV